MRDVLKTILAILIIFTFPIITAYVVVKLFIKGHGTILATIFIILIVLSVILGIVRIVRYNKSKNDK